MKKASRNIYLFIVSAIVLITLTLSACGGNAVSDLPKHSIVVIHSWDSVSEENDQFSKTMDDEFVQQNINAEVHHIYANMRHRLGKNFMDEDWPKYCDSLKKWKPEVILLNDDPIVEWALRLPERDSILLKTPVIFSGVNALLRDSLHRYPLMTGFEDHIDFRRNIELLMKIENTQSVIVELDFSDTDIKLRQQLESILADTTKFVNNSDFHVTALHKDSLAKKYPGQAVVSVISCERPYINHAVGEEESVGKDNILKLQTRSKEMIHLQVKHDIYGTSLIDHSHRPQYTCIREQFNNPGRVRFLGGYFTSTATQISDQVAYAVDIINGYSPKSLPISVHRSDYYMDWNAMQMMTPPMQYSKFSNQFTIINAPEHLADPFFFSLKAGGVLLVVIAIIYGIAYSLSRWKRKGQRDLMEELIYEEKIQNLIFSNAKDTYWHIVDDHFILSDEFAEYFHLPSTKLTFKQIDDMVHEDSKPSLKMLLDFPKQRGRKTLRMRISPDKKRTWYWIEVIYTATEKAAKTGELYGLLLNVDRQKEIEEKLEQAQILASQVALKENFLANISHDLRTPLGAVTGFSSLLAMPGMTFEPGERESYGEIIHDNTNMILNMIDGVMQKAQIETGDLEIIPKHTSVQTLINDCYQTNRIIAPTHLKFKLETAEPDCEINIDATRTKQVINNFLSNAFKFTAEGSVTLGWRYTGDNNDLVEVYVSDTGIGVEKDKQAKLFDRYVKVNETDKGTGLGLNISKTIIEKQEGIIGMEGEFGKGSKFFFRLRKVIQCLLLIVTLGFVMGSASSCSNNEEVKNRNANVLVVHAYDKMYTPYREFNEDINHALLRKGISAHIRHIYLDLENPRRSSNIWQLLNGIDSIVNKDWQPDVILSEGDRAAHVILDICNRFEDLEVLHKTPIVLGSLHHPEWDDIRKHKNIVAINDPIDYCANINLAVEMTGINCVDIELDYFHQDSLIRKELTQAINRPPYVDNTDFHIGHFSVDLLRTVWRDSTLVMCLSVASPEMNAPAPLSSEEGFTLLTNIYANSWKFPCVSVKRDMYSSEIVDKTGRPQFTAVKAGFADGNGRYLCGYFADYHTVGADLGNTGAMILTGTNPTELIGLTHEKKKYMDFAAMQALGMDYNKYCDDFIIVGAPMEYTMPVVYYGTWVVIILVFVGALFSIMLIVQSWRDQSAQIIIDNVRRRAELRNMALHGADSRAVRNEDSVKDIIAHVHPDHSEKTELMLQALEVDGNHNYEILADIDKKGEYHWWQLRFAVMFDHKSSKRVNGILINIDETMRHEEELRQAMMLAEEAKQKEDFLTTISHEIRTPLNAVVGFSDVMISLPEDSFSEEELMQYNKIIKSNNASLSTMIEDILMFSRIESKRIKYIPEEIDVVSLLQEVASEWQDIMPDGVQLRTVFGRPGMYIHNDRSRVHYILTQMMSNAVKFTTHGTIVLGATYNLNHDTVEFFIEDTGVGIPKEKQELAFGLFWKDNAFIPGLGLGLHVAQKLAEGMNITLHVDSKVGVGSRFSIISEGYLKGPERPKTEN